MISFVLFNQNFAQSFHSNLIEKKMYKTFNEAKEGNMQFWNAINSYDRTMLHSPESTINQMAHSWNTRSEADVYGFIDVEVSVDQTLHQLNKIYKKLHSEGKLVLQPMKFKEGTYRLGCTTQEKNNQFYFCETRAPRQGNSAIGWEWGVFINGVFWYSVGCGNPGILINSNDNSKIQPCDPDTIILRDTIIIRDTLFVQKEKDEMPKPHPNPFLPPDDRPKKDEMPKPHPQIEPYDDIQPYIEPDNYPTSPQWGEWQYMRPQWNGWWGIQPGWNNWGHVNPLPQHNPPRRDCFPAGPKNIQGNRGFIPNNGIGRRGFMPNNGRL